MKKKAQLSIYVVTFVILIMILMVAGIFAPMGVRMVVDMYAAGESIANTTSTNNIQDSTVKAAFDDSIQGMKDSTAENVTLFGGINQYGWAIALVIVSLIVWLFSRRLTEYGGIA